MVLLNLKILRELTAEIDAAAVGKEDIEKPLIPPTLKITQRK